MYTLQDLKHGSLLLKDLAIYTCIPITVSPFHTCTILSTICVFSEQCRASLGMQSGEIPNSAITASSSFNDDSVGPSNAR